ncbi:DUF5956 family protein [Arthrobacter sp. NamB2]|uniref:DUF5956 family protein n=1 Tax=Arthrobacter sp. NamB2 TaxID=2576035 RepID=UPI00167381EB|nr:DUF5956 family protein [Arthrobacter sp. NamB2]
MGDEWIDAGTKSRGHSMDTTDWDDVAEGSPGTEWWETTENGLGVVTAWAAGTANVRKTPTADLTRSVSVSGPGPGGIVRTWTEPFTEADRETVNEAIEYYLGDAGIPLPPRGWTWLIRRPPAVGNDRHLWAHLNRQIALHASSAPHPAEIAQILRSSMATLYAEPE